MSRPTIAAMLAVCLTAGFPRADELLERSIENLSDESGENCSYTATRTSSDDSIETIRYQPTKPHWTLLMVNGRHPTEAELEEFIPFDVPLGQPVTLNAQEMGTEHVLVSTDNGQAVYNFRPIRWNGKRTNKPLRGTLTIDVESAMVTRQTIRATKAFSPIIFMRVKEFSQDTEFTYDDNVGGVVVKRTAYRILIRAMGLRKIEEQAEIEFSDFDCT